ncbi:hypothetical protein LCGC14_0345870 [marine sediment metagenome]|uniref:Uncharacterized protein n=1 Tax=marine sediment metagenome TaxID=412755 RepID=A0A0F9TC61_9ZZZZ
MKCKDCKYFQWYSSWTYEKEGVHNADTCDYGFCHRYPPTHHNSNDKNPETEMAKEHSAVWPDDWCGEFKEKD